MCFLLVFQKFNTSTPRSPLLSSLQPGACQKSSKHWLRAALIPPVLALKKAAIKCVIFSEQRWRLNVSCKATVLFVKGQNQAKETIKEEQKKIFFWSRFLFPYSAPLKLQEEKAGSFCVISLSCFHFRAIYLTLIRFGRHSYRDCWNYI